MYQWFARPDRYMGLTGHLACAVVERHIADAPAFMRGLKVLFVTDTHITPRTTQDDIAAFVARLAKLRPDLVLWGGDYADRAEDARRLFEQLGKFSAPLGMYGVLGNNDPEAWPDIDALREVMRRAGVRLLVNESARIERGGGCLLVAGVDEHLAGRPDVAGLYPPERGPDGYRILLSHYPILPTVPPDFMLSGHTHGGQFNGLGITPYVIGFERLSRRKPHPEYIAGMHQRDGMRILVSKGIGASRLQMRVGARPEIEWVVFD